MDVAIARSDRGSFPGELLASLIALVAEETGGSQPDEMVFRGEHSNDLMEIRFQNGRSLMVKRGRFAWVSERFATSRVASDLLRNRAKIAAPEPLDLPPGFDVQPLEAYWRIPHPTLLELWPLLPLDQRPAVLRSWGALIRRVHEVKLCGHGSLGGAHASASPLGLYLERELSGRLRPSIEWEWPVALGIVDRLVTAIPEVDARARQGESTLIHNDLHMGNVLCEMEDGEARCVGLLDLEAALAGPPEADLANAHVMHGPLFAQPIDGPWFEHVREGYAAEVDPLIFAFFRTYHLLNLGFYSAIVGHDEHAQRVAEAGYRGVEAMDLARRATRPA